MKFLKSAQEQCKKFFSKDGKQSFPWRHVGFFAVLGVVILICLSFIWVYAAPKLLGERGMMLRQKMPYPLVFIGADQMITYRDFSENTRAVKQFYENQDFSELGLRVDFTTEEGKKRFQVRQKEILNKMIEDQALMRLAQENNIVVTKEMARDGIRRSLDEYGTSNEVQKDLKRLYGWELKTFEEKVVTPKLYQEKLQALFEEQEKPNEEAYKKITEAKQALTSGKTFDATAKEFSEGGTKKDGGTLGWFQVTDLAPELQLVVPSQQVGVPTDIIESELGYHIVLVEEVKKEGDKNLYRLSQIFTKKNLFTDWLTEKMQAMHVFILSPDYRWNHDEARVEFKSESMRMYEKELYKSTEGDALFLF